MAVLRVVEAFADFRSGHPDVYNPGRLVEDNDPVVKGRENHFEPVEVSVARFAGVEAATAAPGEKRSRGPRLGKPQRKADDEGDSEVV